MYAFIISTLTLGFLILIISLKSVMLMDLGMDISSEAFPLSNSSFTTRNCADWHMSFISLALYPSHSFARSSGFRDASFFKADVYWTNKLVLELVSGKVT